MEGVIYGLVGHRGRAGGHRPRPDAALLLGAADAAARASAVELEPLEQRSDARVTALGRRSAPTGSPRRTRPGERSASTTRSSAACA